MHKHYHIEIVFCHEWSPIHKCQPRFSQSKPSSSTTPPLPLHSSTRRPASSPTTLFALMFVNVAAPHLSINICVQIVDNFYFLPKIQCSGYLETHSTELCTFCNCDSSVRSDVVINCDVGNRSLSFTAFLLHPEGNPTRTLPKCAGCSANLMTTTTTNNGKL